MDFILALDEQVFRIINGQWHLGWLDAIMPHWRDKKFWYPLYIVLLVLITYKFRVKGIYLLLALFLTVGIADLVSSKVFKPTFKRLRPCNDPAIQDDVVLLTGCGRAYSFTSSHATNHFAIAGFLVFTLGWFFKRWKWLFYFWAASIAFGQVYVGVHYPLDVIVGTLLGLLIAYLMAKLYLNIKPIQIQSHLQV